MVVTLAHGAPGTHAHKHTHAHTHTHQIYTRARPCHGQCPNPAEHLPTFHHEASGCGEVETLELIAFEPHPVNQAELQKLLKRMASPGWMGGVGG